MFIKFILFLLINYIIVLIRIAFFTLLERKFLGYFQTRKGPNKVSFKGIPQPLADALKLFSKEFSFPSIVNSAPFIAAPALGLILTLLIWSLFPSTYSTIHIKLGILFFLCVSRINVYTTLIAGWSRNSKYALFGAIRRIAQTISYEVRIAFILISPLIIISSLNLYDFINYRFLLIFTLPPLTIMWFITLLAETNRTPFDLAEGESELVSGFNIEYRGGGFALIFIAEYANILFISLLTTALFFALPSPLSFINLVIVSQTIGLARIFIWVRGAYPRMRYDQLINLTWKTFLPFALSSFIFFIVLSLK